MGSFLQFGSLVDALITEPHLVDATARTLIDSAGDVYTFSAEQWAQAEDMKRDTLANSFVAFLLKSMQFQEEKYIRDKVFNVDGYEIKMHVKCKYDGVSFEKKIGADLKTTACTTAKSFLESILMFNYDRQGAWYMDLGELDRFVIIGISKIKNKLGHHPIFVFAIERGDAMHSAGRAKYERLVRVYDLLVISE